MARLDPAEFRTRIEGLIARLAAATGPDRVLDRDILQAYVDREAGYHVEGMGQRMSMPPHYTSGDITVRDMAQLAGGANWWLLARGKHRDDMPLFGASIYRPQIGDIDPIGEGEHASSAGIAFCIAALRAWVR